MADYYEPLKIDAAAHMTKREEVAARIMAGFASNPSVFAPSELSGWILVNSTERQLAEYAAELADSLLEVLATPTTRGPSDE